MDLIGKFLSCVQPLINHWSFLIQSIIAESWRDVCMLFSTILETMTPYKSDLLKAAPSALMNKSSIHQYATQRSEREREILVKKGLLLPIEASLIYIIQPLRSSSIFLPFQHCFFPSAFLQWRSFLQKPKKNSLRNGRIHHRYGDTLAFLIVNSSFFPVGIMKWKLFFRPILKWQWVCKGNHKLLNFHWTETAFKQVCQEF